MINKIKKALMLSMFLSLFGGYNVLSQVNENSFYGGILNSYNLGEIIYLLNGDGELIKLNSGMEDTVPDDLPPLKSIEIDEDGFVALTKDNKLISSGGIFIADNVTKVDRKFFLTDNNRVSSLNSKNARSLLRYKNIQDIKALSSDIVMLYNEDGTVDIVGTGENGIGHINNLADVVDITVFNKDVLLVMKKDGSIQGYGDGYGEISSKIEMIINGKEFINTGENLYVLTFDNKAIPIIEGNFKAPEEYLSNISKIVINRFGNAEGGFYKAYFITPAGEVSYYIQSDNKISDFNKKKMEYINTFTNVSDVFESGYLTIVLHRDGSINIPFNINHELNGITGVRDVKLKNQSYIVYLEDGQVITSLDNLILDRIDNITKSDDELYNYLNLISVTFLNNQISYEDFQSKRESLLSSEEEIKSHIKSIVLDRKFVMLDLDYSDIKDMLYMSILNSKASDDEYRHMEYMIGKMEDENKSKEEIIDYLVDYIFENPIFKDIIDKFTQM